MKKFPTIPTLVTPEGEVIGDGVAIIEHFESTAGRPSQPSYPKQRTISALFDVSKTASLLRPAMRCRWIFLDRNSAFVRYHLQSQRDIPERADET